MGAARSVLRRATSIKGSTRERFLLTDEEVEEDAACLEAQRRSIKYCVDNLYYGAPVQLSGVRTPKHHLPSALVAFDAGRGSLGAEMLWRWTRSWTARRRSASCRICCGAFPWRSWTCS